MFMECARTEEVYRNGSKYECKGESNGGSELRVWRYVECVKCAGIEIELSGRVE